MISEMEAQTMQIDRVSGNEKCGLRLAMVQLHQGRGEIKARGLTNCKRK